MLSIMKVIILYRPDSEYARKVETFLHDFNAKYGDGKLEVMDVDSREGIATSSLYDVMQFPAVLALNDQGAILKGWEGDSLPQIDEVAFYTPETVKLGN
jgi:hypothetical protein